MLGHHAAIAVQAAGHELCVLHREQSNLESLDHLQFQSVLCNADNEQSLTQAFGDLDAVIHAAGFYPTRIRPWREDVAQAEQQIQGFLRAVKASGIGQAVYLGAAIALKKRADGQPATEADEYSDRPASNNPYLLSKWLMDKAVMDAGASGTPVCVAIPSMTFGEYDYGPSTGQLITRLANGTLPAYVGGRRNVIYAGDAGKGLLAAAEQGKAGERYLLTGSNTDMDAIVAQIAKVSDQPLPRRIPLGLAKLVSKIQIFKHQKLGAPEPVLTPTAIAVMSAGQHLDGSKAASELGFESQVPMEDAISRAYQWFQKVGYISD